MFKKRLLSHCLRINYKKIKRNRVVIERVVVDMVYDQHLNFYKPQNRAQIVGVVHFGAYANYKNIILVEKP